MIYAKILMGQARDVVKKIVGGYSCVRMLKGQTLKYLKRLKITLDMYQGISYITYSL